MYVCAEEEWDRRQACGLAAVLSGKSSTLQAERRLAAGSLFGPYNLGLKSLVVYRELNVPLF